MNQIREIQRINEEELSRGIAGTPGSWHAKYSKSAWVYVGGLDVKLSEGDVLAVLSEYGEIEDLHLIREESTGKSKGFCFCKYEDNRSCVLAVDNLCGFNLLGRSMRVDHVENYRLPKNLQEKETELQKRLEAGQGLEGHAYEGVELANEFSLHQGHDIFAKPEPKRKEIPTGDDDEQERRRRKEEKRKEKEEKRLAKESRKRERDRIRAEREERRREKRAKDLQERGDDHDKDDEDRKRFKKHKRSSSRDDSDGREDKKHSKKHKRSRHDSEDDNDRKHSKRDRKDSKRDRKERDREDRKRSRKHDDRSGDRKSSKGDKQSYTKSSAESTQDRYS